MTCSHCGTVAEPGDGFCRGCGRGLASATASSAAAAQAADAAPEDPRPSQAPAAAPAPAPAATTPPSAGAARWGESGTRPFLYEGNWYSRTGGIVYQYNEAAQQWLPRSDDGVPYFMRRPQFASLRTPSLILYALFGLFILLAVLTVVADAYQFSTFQQSADGESVSQTKLDGARAFWDIARGLQSFVILAIIPVFIWWTRRATCNVRALGAARPEFSPGWAVGWWFIPFANWVQPLRVLNQAWRASDPSLPLEETDGWRKARLTPLLPIWWISYMLISTAWSVPISLLDDETLSASEIADISMFALVADILMIALTGLAVAVVQALSRRQDAANARFEMPAG